MHAKHLITEGRHKPGCACGFCKNMGRLGRKKQDAVKDAAKPETSEPVQEGRRPSLLVLNRSSGMRYPATAEHWPEHGWYLQVYDLSSGAWGLDPSGVGEGPVIDQGFERDLRKRGWTIPPLSPSPDVRKSEMQRLAATFAKPPVAEAVVTRLLT